jgi:hypothetical protein
MQLPSHTSGISIRLSEKKPAGLLLAPCRHPSSDAAVSEYLVMVLARKLEDTCICASKGDKDQNRWI